MGRELYPPQLHKHIVSLLGIEFAVVFSAAANELILLNRANGLAESERDLADVVLRNSRAAVTRMLEMGFNRILASTARPWDYAYWYGVWQRDVYFERIRRFPIIPVMDVALDLAGLIASWPLHENVRRNPGQELTTALARSPALIQVSDVIEAPSGLTYGRTFAVKDPNEAGYEPLTVEIALITLDASQGVGRRNGGALATVSHELFHCAQCSFDSIQGWSIWWVEGPTYAFGAAMCRGLVDGMLIEPSYRRQVFDNEAFAYLPTQPPIGTEPAMPQDPDVGGFIPVPAAGPDGFDSRRAKNTGGMFFLYCLGGDLRYMILFHQMMDANHSRGSAGATFAQCAEVFVESIRRHTGVGHWSLALLMVNVLARTGSAAVWLEHEGRRVSTRVRYRPDAEAVSLPGSEENQTGCVIVQMPSAPPIHAGGNDLKVHWVGTPDGRPGTGRFGEGDPVLGYYSRGILPLLPMTSQSIRLYAPEDTEWVVMWMFDSFPSGGDSPHLQIYARGETPGVQGIEAELPPMRQPFIGPNAVAAKLGTDVGIRLRGRYVDIFVVNDDVEGASSPNLRRPVDYAFVVLSGPGTRNIPVR
jgi:hypothetical protein